MTLHALLVFIVALLSFLLPNPGRVLAISGALCCATYLYIAKIEAGACSITITPISWYFVFQAFTCGLGAVVLALSNREEEAVYFTVFRVSFSELLVGYQIYLLGSLAEHCGLQVMRPRKSGLPKPEEPQGQPESIFVLAISVLAGIIIAWQAPAVKSLGLLGGTFSLLTLATACSAVLNPPRQIGRGSGLYWLGAIGLTGTIVVAHASIGLKFYLLLAAMPICWVVLSRRGARIVLPFIGMGLLFSYIYVIEPTITQIRSERRSTNEQESGATILARMVTRLVTPSNDQNTLLSDDENRSSTFVRAFPATPAGFFVREVQARGFQYGETLTYLRYAFIPRIFWPGKPTTSRGSWFTYYLGNAGAEESATSSTAMSAQGELYWNFGLPGVVLGMFILGSLYAGLLWRQAGPRPARTPLHMLAYLNAMLLASGETEAGGAIIFVVGYFCVLQGALFLAKRFPQGSRRNAVRGTEECPWGPVPESVGIEVNSMSKQRAAGI